MGCPLLSLLKIIYPLKKERKPQKKPQLKLTQLSKPLHILPAKVKQNAWPSKPRASKCKLAKFTLKAANAAVKAYKAALSKKSVKGQVKASGAFKKAMAPVAACNITPKKMAGAFKRGFKIVKGKKAKKAAK